MNAYLYQTIFTIAFLLGFDCLSASADDGAKPTSNAFKITTDTIIDSTILEIKQNLTTKGEIHYRWLVENNRRTLLCDSSFGQIVSNGKTVVKAFMNSEMLVDTKGDKKTEVLTKDANDKLKKILTTHYNRPLCTVDVDEHGQETNRTILIKDDAVPQIQDETIPTCTLFHTPYFDDKPEWITEMKMMTGKGNFALGNVTYKKIESKKQQQTVEFEGILKTPSFINAETMIGIKNCVHKISGEQTYDPLTKEYVSGKLEAKLSMDIEHDNKPAGSATGMISYQFQRIEDEKK